MMVDGGSVDVPSGPGRALVLAVDPVCRQRLESSGWDVVAVPLPAGDLTGLALGAAENSADLVVIEQALTPLHHADKRAALAVAIKWLRPGGLLILREPFEASAGQGGRLRVMWHAFVHGRLDPHHGPAPVQFWKDACHHAGYDHIEATTAGQELTVRASRRTMSAT